MLKIRKFLSIALVVVMLLSTVAFSSSALAEGKEVGLVLIADKTVDEIVPGAEVTVYLHFEMADWSQLMSDTKVALFYDQNVYTPDLNSRTFLGDWANYAKDATKATTNMNWGTQVLKGSTMSDEEKATYNNAVMLTAGSDAALGATNKAGYSVTEGENGISVAECSIVFKVTGDADAIKNGNINITICDACDSNQYIKATDGSSTPKNKASGIDATRGNILANMEEPAADSIINWSKNQIRFRGIGENGGEYQDVFDVRMVATLTVDDTDDTVVKEKISEIGFVWAAKSNVPSFDVEKAKTVAESDSDGDYVKYDVKYLKRAGEGKYELSCLIEDIDDADKEDGVSVLGFVCYDGEWSYFTADVSYIELYQYMPV